MANVPLPPQHHLSGVVAAVLSSMIGGSAVAVTRFAIGATDPITLGVFRFAIGVLLLLPVAWVLRERMPGLRDLAPTILLGLLFFGGFPVLFNAALARTTAARGALALSTLPLLTMLVAALLGAEHMTRRKLAGVLMAMAGVAIALVPRAGVMPHTALAGDLLMLAAALCMAFYNVWSRPLIARSGPVTFTVVAMAAGTTMLSAIAAATGGFLAVSSFDRAQWAAVIYLSVAGGALAFLLWAIALARTSPTRVAISVTVNPLVASLLGALLLNEPVTAVLLVGLVVVAGGIYLATTKSSPT